MSNVNKRNSAAVVLLALCTGFELFISAGNIRLYTLISVCCVFFVISAFAHKRELFRFDLICAVLSGVLTFSVRMNFDLIAFMGADLVSVIEKFWFLLFFVWYFFLRSVKLINWSAVRGEPRSVGRHLSLAQIAFLAALFGLILLFTSKPYFMNVSSQDVLDQSDQIHGVLAYNNVHAIGHTLFLKFMSRIYDSFGLVVIFQLAMVVLLYISFADFFYFKGLPLYLVVLFQGLTLIFIRNSTLALYMPWKDTPAALCLGVVSLVFMRHLDSGGMKKKDAFVLGLALAWSFLFRLNGIVALIICGGSICFSLLRKKLFPQMTLLVVAAAASILSVNMYAEHVLHAIDIDNGFSIQVFGSGIAAVVNDGELSPQELEEIDKVLPVEWMQGRDMRELIWDHDNSPRITSDPNMRVYNNEYVLRMGENKKDVILLYLKLLPSHFVVCLKDLLDNVGMVWKLEESFFVSNYIFQFVLLTIIFFGNRLKGMDLLPFLPSLCNTVSIVLSSTTNETRYLLPTFLLAPCLILFSIMRGRMRSDTVERVPI